MKCIIVYFSQTGNTEKVAKAILNGVKKANYECDIVKLKNADPRRLYEYDLIGLGSPIFYVEPGNLRTFIKHMRFVDGKHIFVFNTHGTLPELYFSSIYPRLKEKGLVVIGMRDWYGSCYLSHCPKPYFTDGHPDEIDLKEAEEFGKEMVDKSQRIEAGESELIPPPPVSIDQIEWTPPMWIANAFKSMAKFHKEKCIYPQCRLCMDNCPMNGIDISIDPPILFKPCLDCEFCVKICPTGAIDANEYAEYATKGFYKDLDESLLPNLKKDEEAGKFRRLVPDKEIGWDTPVSKMMREKHPLWVIGKGLQ